ncbi:MAG: biotin--[acetyl-CoA-carboxylase] ligase [Halanaeroarchaeum sp.]
MQRTRQEILDAIATGPVSGPALADRLDVSRTAVWKHVEALRDAGFEIPSGEEGYRLASVPDYGAAAIEYGLRAPYEVEFHDAVESTNAVARERAEGGARDLVVLADEQTGGRGRQDRSWASPSGGVWMSLVLRPDLPPARVPLLTLAAAVAVTEAIADRGIEATIKWPNDVHLADDGLGPKLCGVLTEMTGESDRVSWVVVGIGLNANVDPDALPEGATSLEAAAEPVDRRTLVQDVLHRFDALAGRPDDIVDAWRSHAATLGARVRIDTGTSAFEGTAVDVTATGALVVEGDGDRRTIHAGDCEHLREV